MSTSQDLETGRYTFPTGKALTIRTTRSFRQRNFHRGPHALKVGALLHLMLIYHVRALLDRQDLHRLLGLLHDGLNGVAMAHHALSGGPLVTLEKDGLRVPVYLEDVVGMQGIELPRVRRVRWGRMCIYSRLVYPAFHELRMEDATGFKIVRGGHRMKDLAMMTFQEQEVEMGIRRSARRALHHLLGSSYAAMHTGPEVLRG